MDKINNTTYKIENLGDIKPLIKIGGDDPLKFLPSMNLDYFDKEFFLKISRENKLSTAELVSEKGENIEFKVGDDTDIFSVSEGKPKWDIRFDKRPVSDTINFKIEHSDDLTFARQESLADEYDAGIAPMMSLFSREQYLAGFKRPENVIGSYAIFCNKSNNKYKSGKVGHLYKHFVIDSKGNLEWCTLNKLWDTLTVTLPKKFMDNAVYPVWLDPILGINSIGASTSSRLPITVVINSNVTMPEDGTAVEVFAYAVGDGSSTNSNIGVYNDDGTGDPGTLFDGPDVIAVTSTSPAWYSSLITGSLTSGTKYFPAWSIQNAIYFDTFTDPPQPSGWYINDGTMPSSPTALDDTGKLSLYLDYTAAGGGSIVPILMHHYTKNILAGR